jgi:GNAT superfamily N-acetyltransferase
MTRFRRAVRADLPVIVGLLADDMLGAAREDPASEGYQRAFDVINEDANQYLLVGERDSAVIAFLQLTFIRGLGRRGACRAHVESVRVAAAERSRGVGAELMRCAMAIAREHHCEVLQLTTDKRRRDAHRFYERLGFVASHEGMKLAL